jgi:hypothetical protein
MGTRTHQGLETAESTRQLGSSERAAVRDQLERILASPLFRNSKRYTSLLRFAVEHRLSGDIDVLKERLLGIQVFGRDPDYNTTQDPVVRTSAVEVRKRLGEYYQQPGHDSEIRIDLPAGCYIPEFHTPVEVSAAETIEAPAVPAARAPAALPRRSLKVWAPGAALAVLVVTGAIIWRVSAAPDALERFWQPVTGSSGSILFSVVASPPSQPEGATSDPTGAAATLSQIFRSGQNAVPLPDVTALVNIAGYLKRTGKAERIEISRNVQFQDLKAGPAVIIGPLTPRWREILSADWRFSVERDPQVTVTWIQDREKPESRAWSVEVNAAANSTSEAYALVTRVWNETLGQTVVSVAGLSPYGTTAAGEFLSDPGLLEGFAAHAPKGWDRRNIQLVIAAKRVGTSSGRPRAVASYFW